MPLVLEKNKHAFGNLLNTLNTYLVYGKLQFSSNKEAVLIFAKMAETALFTQ